MLRDLVDYYNQLVKDCPEEVAPIGWSSVRVIYVAQLTIRGELIGLIPITDRTAMARMVPAQVKRASNVVANFLCDNASYIFGLQPAKEPEYAEKRFESSVKLHHMVLDNADSICAKAILAYFDNNRPSIDHPVIAGAGDKLFSGGSIVFNIKTDDELLDPLDDGQIRRAWEEHLSCNGQGPIMRCLVTGDLAPIARLHPSIKGVYGAQSSGASLVSFNAPAFESYGHENEQGRNAPVGERSAHAYTTALNYLLSHNSHHTRLGDTTVVYWSDRKDAQNTAAFAFTMGNTLFGEPSTKENTDEIVDATMKSIARGAYRDLDGIDLDATFHVLGLAPSAARLAVKFYYKDSFGNMLNNLSKHYQRSDIVHSPRERAYLSPYQLLKDVEHPKAKKPVVVPILTGPLLNAMLEDAPYPQALYTNALLRIHATQEDPDNHVHKVTRARASIIRAYLIKNCKKVGYDEKGLTVSLNDERNMTAYCLGRAFAILEQIQETANDGKATITNRYFNAASTTPLAVFPTIVRLSDAHLTKIGRTQPGLAIYLKKQLHKVLGEDRVSVFPKRLSLEEQGDFILGYIHQRNKRYEGKGQNNEQLTDQEEE